MSVAARLVRAEEDRWSASRWNFRPCRAFMVSMPPSRLVLWCFLSLAGGNTLTLSGGCAHRVPGAAVDSALPLSRVVLYRSGVAYFERRGTVRDGVLRLSVRRDQVDDVLKSLTVVDRSSGRAVRASLPLDGRDLGDGALSALDRGNLAQLLAALRGRRVTLRTRGRTATGRVVLVEEIHRPARGSKGRETVLARDHRVTLADGGRMHVAYLSKVRGISIHDRRVALHLARRLDAAAGEGMFQQVELEVELAGPRRHDLVVSYVVGAPMWKPTYRVVLPETRRGKALLQGWAVVDNTSGEDWEDVHLVLTAGAPIAFRYDLHTPRTVDRVDLTEAGVRRRAAAAIGETSWEDEGDEAIAAPGLEAEYSETASAGKKEGDRSADRRGRRGHAKPRTLEAPAHEPPASPAAGGAVPPPPAAGMQPADLARSMAADTRARQVAGLVQYDLAERLSVPAGTATLVGILNAEVEAEEVFLFKPGGSGPGFESNPYRVVRVRNTTPFSLEPGPMAIYAGGSFVGEGLTEPVGAGASVTIPFAVEPSILVTSKTQADGGKIRLVRFARGVLEVESFGRRTTTWTVRRRQADEPARVLVRHAKAGPNYDLVEPATGVERVPDAYLVPVELAAGANQASVRVVEKTPSRFTVGLWDRRAPAILDTFLAQGDLSPKERRALAPIVRLRQEIGRIDTEIDGLRRQIASLESRAESTRKSLEAIKKDPRATTLRARLSRRLEAFTKEADALSRRIVDLESKRLEKKIAVEDAVRDLVIE